MLKPVFKLLAILLPLVSPFMLVSAAVGLAYGETLESLWGFGLAAGISFVPLAISMFVLRTHEKPKLSPRASFLFVSLAWFLVAAWGAIPFVVSGAIPSYADAFFESASGFTTTGASILTDIEALPRSLLFWRSLTHWLGGMGIVVLTVAIFPLLGYGGLRLMEAEAPGPSVDKIAPRIAGTAKILWLIYVGLSAIQAALLLFGGMDLFDSLTHTFGTMATGGFSTRNASVGAFGSAYVDVICTVFMVLAGMNFSLHFKLLKGGFREVARDGELKVYLFILVSSAMVIAIDLGAARGGSFLDNLRLSGFQSASILTTTGFATADFDLWPPLSKCVLFVLMFIGGCSGSTGGGIKVVRIVTLFKMSLTEMKYLLHPKGQFGIFVGKRYLRKNVVYDISAFVFLYLGIFALVTLAVAAAGQDLLSSATASIACLGNIGPGFAAFGPTRNYGFLPDATKAILSFAMIAGRLEVYTVLVLFTRSFWRK